MKTEFKKGLKQGFSLPGFAMGSAMIGFGALAYESNLDYFVTIASMLFLWSMPGMVIFVSLFSIGTPIFLLFTTVLLANMRQFFLVLSGLTLMNIHKHKLSFITKLFWAHLISPTGWAELTKVKNEIDENKPVLVCVMDEKFLDKYYALLNKLRNNGINSEIFLESNKKLSKQLEYANRKDLKLAVICGENEFKDNTITIKNLKGLKGSNQSTVLKDDLIDEIKKLI